MSDLHTITGIMEKSAGSARFAVAVDGAMAGVVSAAAIADLGLRIGATLDVRGMDRLRDAIGEQTVFDKALDLLEARQRSTRDLQRRLSLKGFEKAQVEGAIRRLTALGFLNDANYASELVGSKLVRGGMSKRRVSQELFRHGVARDLADAAISEAVEENQVDEHEAALDVARRRIGKLRGLDADTQRRRLYSFLARRGYDGDVVAKAVRQVLTEPSEGDDVQ
jgi:regulatory protein